MRHDYCINCWNLEDIGINSYRQAGVSVRADSDFPAFLDIKFVYKYAYIVFIFSLFLLLSVEIIGVFGKGATRWINFFGFNIQPSEIIKITIILALARFYHDLKYENVKYITNLIIPFLILSVPFFLVVIQPDLGTALSILMLGIFILFASGLRIWKFLLSSIAFNIFLNRDF